MADKLFELLPFPLAGVTMDSTGNAASAPPRSMEILDSLCEHCYGLAMDCLYCSNVGTQRRVNSWDPIHVPHLESLSHYYADSFPSTGGWLDHLALAPSLPQTDRAKYSQLSGTLSPIIADRSSKRLSCDEPTTQVLEVEQGEQIPAYRRHTKSKAQVKLLREWFGVNPTPTGPQLFEYAKLVGLEKDQVRNWFVNQRRPSRRPNSRIITSETKDAQQNSSVQIKRGLGNELGSKALPTIRPIATAGRSHRSSLTDSLRSIPDIPESMMERWHNSSPDEEPANLGAIRRAMKSSTKVDTKPTLAQNYSRRLQAENNVMVLIENVPVDMTMVQFVQIMLLKDIKKPRTFHYQFENGTFRGLAFAEFRSKKDAFFAISRLNHILLDGCTLHVQLESPLAGPEPHVQNKNHYQVERSHIWRTAASSDGSAASSIPHSTSSSALFARRRYKNAYRKDDYQQQATSDFDSIYVLNQEHPPINFNNILSDRPSLSMLPGLSDQGESQNSSYESSFGMDGVVFCDEPEKMVGDNAEDVNSPGILDGTQGVETQVDQIVARQYHSCQRYHCQSCTRKFNTEADWRAHESLIHRPREEWVCSLVPCMNPSMTDWKCAFCQSPFSDWAKFVLHDCRPCGIAPTSPTSRPVFNTRTDLADHVKHHHGGAVLTPFMVEKWSRPPTWEEGIWACSTCGSSIQGWQNRLDHLAGHYKLEISKNKCRCLMVPDMQTAMSRIIGGEVEVSSVSVDAEEKEDEASSSDYRSQEASRSVKPSDQMISLQDKSYGFVAQARAWITRSMRRP